MSHELKHPLNLITVNAELLSVLPEAQDLPAVQRAAATIRRTVQGQARIIDDLLDMSRTNAGKLAVNRVPLLSAKHPAVHGLGAGRSARLRRAPLSRSWPIQS
jgi:signal transduction histidine kinase